MLATALASTSLRAAAHATGWNVSTARTLAATMNGRRLTASFTTFRTAMPALAQASPVPRLPARTHVPARTMSQFGSRGFQDKRRFVNAEPWYQNRTTLYGTGIAVVGTSLYYVAHLEEVPISGRRRFMNVSTEREEQMAKTAYNQVMMQYGPHMLPATHPTTRTVERVATKIIRAAGMEDLRWEFHVIDSREQNAFVLPGGKVFVFTGILPVCKDENGLAIVLGHEIAHQMARHSAEKVSISLLVELARIAVTVFFDTSYRMTGIFTELGLMRPFSRSMESEADHIGLLLAAQACYDPAAAVGFWQRMAAKGESGPAFLSTHPAHRDRIEQIREWLPEAERRREMSNCHEAAGFLADMFHQMHQSRW
ncbi:hypothetical protein AMAG_06378 [Allomyces macrogynus ATCC 38327]|uniref:Peptidase M48 domain-containing protein n=1 Tax=Allomyces macrogynus (strain ATCC 38327) TaxID=578462 RepID=A0A0L0SGI1_ALLM3|nr:hypothetical protein AMAG_06378 [Allomyces macrogynus ATCC 38327]|eukprot:KNE61562.1 hypothetical protein AMAG_06378 [Allomyces macrogynus ATCC 38327]